MDAINRLPVTPMDAGQPRDRVDASPDQTGTGFSFESLLDERNLASSHHPPMEAEEQGTDVLVKSRDPVAVETGEEVITLVAMLSTPPPPMPLRIPDELAATELTEESQFVGEQLATSVTADVDQRRHSVPLAADTASANQPRRESLPTANPRDVAVVENNVSRPTTSTDGKLMGVTEAVDRAIPKDAVAEVPSQDAASLTHETALTHRSEALPNIETPLTASGVANPIQPVELATVNSSKDHVPLVAAPVIHGASKRPEAFSPATRPLESAATGLVSSASGFESPRSAQWNPVTPGVPSVRGTTVLPASEAVQETADRSEDLDGWEPQLGQGIVARTTEPVVVGRVEEPLVREFPKPVLAPTPPILPVEESTGRDASYPGQRNLPVTRGPLPPTIDTVFASIPEGVTVEVIDSARSATSASPFTDIPATERIVQETAQGVRPVRVVARPDRASAPQFSEPASISFDGTSTATQERVMPDTFQPRSPEPKTVGPAANFNAAEPFTPVIGAQTDGNSSFQNQSGNDTSQEEKSAFQQQPREVIAVGQTFANPVNMSAPAVSEPTLITRTDVETIVHRTEEAAERLRVTGNERVEVKVRLEAGQELTVRLRFSNGEVTPVFLTESQDLRQVIEQNWAQFSERSSERTTRVTTPVFESPNSQSGMNDLNQRQREGRERAFTQAQAEAFAAANAPGRVAPRRPDVEGPTLTAPTGLQLYA